jgi:hypothetical protein
MVIEPSDQFSCLGGNLCSGFVDFEVVAKSELELQWDFVKNRFDILNIDIYLMPPARRGE